MQDLILALRNIGRNRRRSAVTMLAVALSCGGLTLFGGYVSWTFRAVEEQTVGTSGHLQIYQRGYYDEGSGDPASYALGNYEEIRGMLLSDPVIGPRVELVTPQILFTGLVTSPRTRASSTFVGLGVLPSEEKYLNSWNPYKLFRVDLLKVNAPFFTGPAELDDTDTEAGSIGTGLGKVLRLDKPAPAGGIPAAAPSAPATNEEADINFLTAQSGSALSGATDKPAVDLLSSPPDGGAPNVTSMTVRRVVPRATKEMDDHLIKMHIRHASELIFPGQPPRATAVLVLLRKTEDTAPVAGQLTRLIQERGLNLEFKAWDEIRPFYRQIKRMLGIIFVFVFLLLAMLVAFTIYNTQSAGILERMAELGTMRAIGVTRWGLWKILVLEGACLGLLGGLLGLVLAVGGDLLLRAVDIVYIPPGVSFYAKVEVLVLRDPVVMLQAFTGSVLCALFSSALPARRAAYTEIVEALRHS